MRRPVVQAMSGLSVLVLALSWRASRHLSDAQLGVQPAGVVDSGGVEVAPTMTQAPRPVVRRHTAPRTPAAVPTRSVAPRPAATRTTRVTRTQAPAPVRTASPKPMATRPPTVTVNGAPADTQYGPVQVQLDLRGGHIVAARAIEYPQDTSRDQEINSQAIPQLDDEAVQADSAQIDTVSGATYTSDGYRASLQSAIDAATQAGAR